MRHSLDAVPKPTGEAWTQSLPKSLNLILFFFNLKLFILYWGLAD